ncbi:amidophosphoribosyltransferase [Schaedlerella arabinosiphila]|uniref:Amidophosphoribosyltransferase n=1 Tax=Schaedlerella arabinosiphila TaxID=2044587 RepID=A0A9X5H618_9FIRM|nr:amidophosphoribosyltransferase [Schaedlerella arabinosiphila]KAI4441466.1 Amidophosphoribosyltransferase [Schaedlerella arabinosiphila]NDO68605.1 amidophosphoribosyltransferase [Schaedlerella arabinosiphila]
MAIHEECGVFGVMGTKKEHMAGIVYYGLYALQHRGQESCGIVVNDDGVFSSYKDLGLVSEVFSEDTFTHFPMGNMAVGHVRYGTTGGNTRNNCQPIEVNHQKGKLALAHNGNLSNALELRDKLELSGAIFHTTSDTETIAYVITRERLMTPSIEEAVSNTMNLLEGAYSLVMISSTKMIAARDPYGFRPLCYGKTADGAYVAASESCALSAVGAEFIRDVLPGEILVFTENGVESRREHCKKQRRRTCIFEYIYFARPDSVIDGISVHESRMKAGELLAESYPEWADIVIGVPDSGLDAALGYAKKSGIPYGIGLIKNKYIGRTFISPGQNERLDQVRIKLSPVKKVIDGKRVVLIDDSIVRGTTSKRIVKLLRDAGAKEIHMRISAPPFLYPCYYGTDIDSEENLIACHHSTDEIAKIIGADSLGYLPIEKLDQLIESEDYCAACFQGDYPTKIPADLRKDRFERKLSERDR